MVASTSSDNNASAISGEAGGAPFYAGGDASTASAPSLFTWSVTKHLGSEYVPLFQDAMRMICIQATIQLMGYLSQDGAQAAPLLSAEFFLLLLYVLLGVMLYWLAVRRVVAIA